MWRRLHTGNEKVYKDRALSISQALINAIPFTYVHLSIGFALAYLDCWFFDSY